MFLFLDTASPLPEFSIIEDNKIIYSERIIKNIDERMSDNIIQCYMSINARFSLSKKLKFLIINTGPGSYTALRLGISFFSGLSISLKIPIKSIPSYDLFRFNIEVDKLNSTAIFLSSANRQNFICLYDIKNREYKVIKFDEKFNLSNIVNYRINNIVTNCHLVGEFIKLKNIKFEKKNFKELVLKNIKTILLLPDDDIIKPIYISNNEILN